MRARRSLPLWRVLILAGWSVLPVSAGVFELNSVKGLWQLDDSLNARWNCQPALLPQGFTISGSPASQFLPAAPPRTWLDLGSSTAPFGGLKPAERFMMSNQAGPSGPFGAAGTHSWTLVMDVRFPSVGPWTALMQSDAANASDAEIFLNGSRQIQFIGASPFAAASDPLALNTWYRLAFRAEWNPGTNSQILRAFINGVVTAQSLETAFTAAPNGVYSLGSRVLLFSDENNETARLDVGSVGFWGRALSDADLASIGGWDSNGIDWPDITPANSCPPLPALTNVMKFGRFQATDIPEHAPNAATAPAPTIVGTVAQVQIALGSNGGSIPGLPNHRFGGTVTAHVQTTGDVVVTQTVNLNYTGGGPDLGTAAGVTFTRSGLTLGATGARGTARVFLPSGFGVALTPSGKNTLVRANLGNVGLSQNLAPVLSASLTRASFTTDLSSAVLYPIADRIPVRFATNSLSWDPATGRFTFTPTENLVYHRETQLSILLNQILTGRPGAANPASNEFYFLAAKQALGNVTIGARANGAAALQSATITLDPNKFGTGSSTVWMHYPLVPITWNQTAGSQIVFSNDALDLAASKLAGATIAGTGYLQGVPDMNCEGTPGSMAPPAEGMHFVPSSGEWRFRPDGGLRAEGAAQATATSTEPLTVEWGAYLDKFSLQRFAHRIQTGFSTCRISTAGVFGRADQLTGLTDFEKPAALFLSGYSSPANATLLERPGTSAYFDGLADYPGFNLRCTPLGFTAVSRLADMAVPAYPLATEAKYVLRPSGVTGRHLTAPGAPNITFNAFGASFTVTALNLAYLDGTNVASGVNGSLSTGAPASFDLAFKGLKFGAQGQLQEASIASPQGDKILGPPYWNLKFTPLALEFPQPKVCPAPTPDTGFIKVLAKATLTSLSDQPMLGNISVLNGNLVVESDAVAKGNGAVSRFSPGALLSVNGPVGKSDWKVNPVTDVSINKHQSTSLATLTVGGLMDVPFFEDMPVIISTSSMNSSPASPVEYVRKPWESLTAQVYDSGHLGKPANVTLTDYRTLAAHDPIATRKWQDLIAFTFPVYLGANQVFTSRTPVTDDLLMFNLTQAVKTMTPDTAELTFDGSGALDATNLIPQVNVASLLQDAGLAGFPTEVKAALTGALESVTGLDALLKDHLQDLLNPGLAGIAANRAGSTFFNQLGAAPDRGAKLDELVANISTDVGSQLSGATSGVAGRWRRDLLAQVTKARAGMQSALSLVQSAQDLKKLATAIGVKIGIGGNPADPEPNALDALESLFAQVIAQLQSLEAGLQASGDLNTSLNTTLGGAAGATPIVTKAINDLKAKWAPPNPALADGYYNNPANLAKLQTDLAAALTDRFAGSTFAGETTKLLRQYGGDPQTLSRQGVDDLLRMAEQMMASSLNDLANAPVKKALGGLIDFMAAARLRGYARINGDALHELRLDGQARLKTPVDDTMKFDAWFLLRDLDSTTPGSKCLVEGGAKAEVDLGASAELDWAGKKTAISAGGKVAFGAGGLPVGMTGDFAFIGKFGFSEVEINDLKLGFGFGANNGYLYGRGSGKLYSMSITAGVFVGQTCDIEVIKHADDDIGDLISGQAPNYTLPLIGAMVYAEGGMSLMPLIGIPPSCVLDLRVHGGQGYFFFMDSAAAPNVTAGVKVLEGVSGELLCLVDASGKFSTVIAGNGTISGGSPEFTSLAGSAAAKLKGTIGVGWFSVSFSKTVRLKVTADPNLKWNLDY